MRPVSELQRTVAPFQVVSDYQPAGDQPAAIAELARRIEAGEQDIVLLGATLPFWVAMGVALSPPGVVPR